ncbi:proteoglycan 4-like isoform X2 [Bombus pyrosoma]|uniref:proteoglycan 4-like isoform X2 n=1 Tax=Bombus pyrosoma TaxID=396416 RepID=UPI001CB95C5E|nr:proteoglycan 4-like isoform X2 [Bombus pyrosoma]
MVVVGTVYGWTTTSLLHLTSGTGGVPFTVTDDESSWIVSFTVLGSMIGSLSGAQLADSSGRKCSLLLCCALFTLGWLMTYNASYVPNLYLARVILGIGVGIAYTVNPMYVSEIADINIRGALGTLIAVNVFTGSLLTCILGLWLTYQSLLIVLVVMSLISFLTITCFPETPYFLVSKGRKKRASKSITYYKGIVDPHEMKNAIRDLCPKTRCKVQSQVKSILTTESTSSFRPQFTSNFSLRSTSDFTVSFKNNIVSSSESGFPSVSLCETRSDSIWEVVDTEPKSDSNLPSSSDSSSQSVSVIHSEVICDVYPEPTGELSLQHSRDSIELPLQPPREIHPQFTSDIHRPSISEVQPPSTSEVYPSSTSETHPEPTSEIQSESTSEIHPASTSEIQPPSTSEVYPSFTSEIQPPSTSEVYPSSTSETHPEPTSEIQSESTSEIQPQSTSEIHPASTSEIQPPSTSEVYLSSTSETHPEPTREIHPASTSEIQPPSTSEVYPPSTSETHTEPTSEIQSESTSEIQPPSTSEVYPSSTSETHTEPTREIHPASTREIQPQSTSEIPSQFSINFPTTGVTFSESRRGSDGSIEVNIAVTQQTSSSKLRALLERSNRKALIIMLGLVMAQQLSGNFITMQYLEVFFNKTTIGIKPNIATIVVLAVGLASGILSTLTVESLGRKTLLFLSTLGSCSTLLILATYLLYVTQCSPMRVISCGTERLCWCHHCDFRWYN